MIIITRAITAIITMSISVITKITIVIIATIIFISSPSSSPLPLHPQQHPALQDPLSRQLICSQIVRYLTVRQIPGSCFALSLAVATVPVRRSVSPFLPPAMMHVPFFAVPVFIVLYLSGVHTFCLALASPS